MKYKIKVEWEDYDSSLSNNGGSYFQPAVYISDGVVEFCYRDDSCGELSSECILSARCVGDDKWTTLYSLDDESEELRPCQIGRRIISSSKIEEVVDISITLIKKLKYL